MIGIAGDLRTIRLATSIFLAFRHFTVTLPVGDKCTVLYRTAITHEVMIQRGLAMVMLWTYSNVDSSHLGERVSCVDKKPVLTVTIFSSSSRLQLGSY